MKTIDFLTERENMHLYRYDYMHELVEDCLTGIDKYKNLAHDQFFADGTLWKKTDFIGRHFRSWQDVADSLNQGWPEGIGIVERMLAQLKEEGIEPPKSIRRKGVWSEEDGEDLDLDRLQKGQAAWRTTQRTRRPGLQSMTIVTDMATAYNVLADVILWRGAAAITLCYLMEEAGYRCELWAAARLDHPFRNAPRDGRHPLYDLFGHDGALNERVTTAVCLKRPSDALDLSTLIASVSGWSFRTVFLGSLYNAGKPLRDGHGRPSDVRSILDLLTPDGEQAVVSERIWSYKDAVHWVKMQVEQYR